MILSEGLFMGKSLKIFKVLIPASKRGNNF